MLKTKLLGIIATATIAMITSQSGAAVVTSQGFESTASDGWAYTLGGSGGVVSSTNPSTDSPASSRVRSGSFSLQHTTTQDGVAESSTLTFSSVSLVDLLSANIEIHLASISSTSGNGADASDNVQVFVALNGAAFGSTPDLTVGGAANGKWSYASGGLAQTTVGTPTTFTYSAMNGGYSTLSLNIPDGNNSVALKIVSTNNSFNTTSGSKEIWAIDDIALNGTSVPEPTTLGVLGIAGSVLLGRRARRTA